MSWARIAAFFVVAIVLTMHLRAVTQPEGEGEGASRSPTEPFLAAVPERIDRVRFESGTLALQFEKRDGRWVTTEPAGLAPPGDVIEAVVDSFTTLPPIEIVSEGKENQEQFGLVPPRMRIRLESGGDLVSTIVLGELSPTRTAVYARKAGSDDVALIGLNAKYYIDLVFENVRRQRASAGIVEPAPAAPPVDAPAGALPGAASPADAIPPAVATPPAATAPRAATPPPAPPAE